jgi:hypothetical protein
MTTLPREKASGVALADRRVLWLTRLSAPRGRSARSMSAAQWEPGEGLARVLRHKGIDLQSLGHFRHGQQWLRPEEALCMVDDGTLLLLHEGAPLSVQAARALLVGRADATGRAATLQLRLSVFTCLHRNGYVCRIRAPSDGPSSTDEPELMAAYERRGFTRRAVDKEDAPPAFMVACYRADEPLPGADVLCALAQRYAPAPLRCACVQQDEVVFFNVATGIQRPAIPNIDTAWPSMEDGGMEGGEAVGHDTERPTISSTDTALPGREHGGEEGSEALTGGAAKGAGDTSPSASPWPPVCDSSTR